MAGHAVWRAGARREGKQRERRPTPAPMAESDTGRAFTRAHGPRRDVTDNAGPAPARCARGRPGWTVGSGSGRLLVRHEGLARLRLEVADRHGPVLLAIGRARRLAGTAVFMRGPGRVRPRRPPAPSAGPILFHGTDSSTVMFRPGRYMVRCNKKSSEKSPSRGPSKRHHVQFLVGRALDKVPASTTICGAGES